MLKEINFLTDFFIAHQSSALNLSPQALINNNNIFFLYFQYNIDGVITELRKTRSNMVQVSAQYMFLHLFLIYYEEKEKEKIKLLQAKL